MDDETTQAPAGLLSASTPGLREALMAGMDPHRPDVFALWKVVFAGASDDGVSALRTGAKRISPHILQGMMEWVDTPGMQENMPLEQYAVLLSNADWPPPTFMHATHYMYEVLMTPSDESFLDLQGLRVFAGLAQASTNDDPEDDGP